MKKSKSEWTFFSDLRQCGHGVMIFFQPIRMGFKICFLFWTVAVNYYFILFVLKACIILFGLFWRRASEINAEIPTHFKRTRRRNPPASLNQLASTSKQGQNCPLYAHAKEHQASSSKQTFLVLTGWKKVFWNFIVMGLTKIGYLNTSFASSSYSERVIIFAH